MTNIILVLVGLALLVGLASLAVGEALALAFDPIVQAMAGG